jgi:thioredoxin 1
MERLGPKDFEGDRLRRKGTWAIAFLADWCPFCRSFRTLFDRFDGGGSFETAVADVSDYSSPLWDRFRIEVVPSLIAFRDGVAVHRIDGVPMEGLGPTDLDDLRGFLGPARPSHGGASRPSHEAIRPDGGPQ